MLRYPKQTVIIVHGTFAAAKPGERQWYHRAEKDHIEGFTAKLDAALAKRGSSARCWAHFETGDEEAFQWSGDNSWIARTRAAHSLADYVTRLRGDGWRCHIVAHSHGGNVVVEALPQICRRAHFNGTLLGRIVTLGTPFLHTRAPILRRSERAQKSVDAVSRTLFRSIIVIIALIFAAAMKSILPLSILITMVLAHRWNRTDPDARAEISDTQAVSLTYQKLKEFTGLEPLLAIGSSTDEAWQLLHHIQNTQNPFAPNKKFFPYLLASITDQFSIRREIARITGARGYRDLMLRDRLFPSIGTLCCHLSPDFALRKAFK